MHLSSAKRKRSMIRSLAVITGHGPFKIHLQELKLAEDAYCPKCGQDSDTALPYITSYNYYVEARKRTLGLPSHHVSMIQTWCFDHGC